MYKRQVLDTKVIYPTAPQNKVTEAKAELKRLIKKYNVSLISVGNGTASRESEQVIVDLIKELDTQMCIRDSLTGEYDKNGAILKLNAGAGGTESCDWCSMLYLSLIHI